MARSDRIIALDIGASKLVLAEFQISRQGAPQLINYGISDLGIDQESADADNSAYVVSAIREVMRERRIRPAPLMMTVSGQAVFPRYVKLPPVSRDKVLQIVNYEAEQNVPFPINEVVWDYQLIGSIEQELNVMLVAVKADTVTRLTDCVIASGLEPEVVDVAPMALYNVVRYSYPDLQGCTMVLDVGARSSNLIFVEQDRIFSRSIPVAGNAITQELMKEFELGFDEAEQLKKQHAFVAFGGVYAGPDNEVADRVSKIVRNVVTRLHAEVNRSVNFYRSQQGGSPPSVALLAGGSSIIPHMDRFFREKLKVPVEFVNPFVNVAVGPGIEEERVSGDIHLLGEVVGLALRRALTCPVEINLMPPELVAKKVFRKRQPFFAMTVVGVALIMLCWWVYFLRMSDVVSKRSVKVDKRIKDLSSLDSDIKKVAARKDKVVGRIDQLAAVVGMRTQWIEMIEALHDCQLDGMWITDMKPVYDGKAITHIDVSGRGFLDRLADTAEATAVEQFRDLLRQKAPFTDETVITRTPVVSSEDYDLKFTVRLALANPIKVR